MKITYTEQELNLLARAFAKRFISRTDVIAVQQKDGSYRPKNENFTKDLLLSHLRGDITLGHYLLDKDSLTKVFVIDLDLRKQGLLPSRAYPGVLAGWNEKLQDQMVSQWMSSFSTRELCNKKTGTGAWLDRADPAREYIKLCLRWTVGKVVGVIQDELKIKTITAFSPHGAHIYGLAAHDIAGSQVVKRESASTVREGAALALNASGIFKATSSGSKTFWEGTHEQSALFTAEVFPKQDKLDGSGTGAGTGAGAGTGEGLGNLVRLPLGKHLKRPADPCFFIDQDTYMNELRALSVDAVLELLG